MSHNSNHEAILDYISIRQRETYLALTPNNWFDELKCLNVTNVGKKRKKSEKGGNKFFMALYFWQMAVSYMEAVPYSTESYTTSGCTVTSVVKF